MGNGVSTRRRQRAVGEDLFVQAAAPVTTELVGFGLLAIFTGAVFVWMTVTTKNFSADDRLLRDALICFPGVGRLLSKQDAARVRHRDLVACRSDEPS